MLQGGFGIVVRHTVVVRAVWDPEAGVWIATSDDVPGLVAEAETQDRLLEKLKILVPELLELNGDSHPATEDDYMELPLILVSEQVTKVRVPA